MAYIDPEQGRARDLERYRRRTGERLARGMCPRCGEARPAPDHSLCQCCGEKRRKAGQARHAKAKAAGMLYGGRDAERCRRSANDRSKRRDQARRDAGLCTRCGKQKAVEGRTVCDRCHEARGEREREQYATRRAAGECGKCAAPAPGDSARCERCARSAAKPSRKKAKNARSRRRYVRRRVRGALHRLRRTVPGRGPVPGVRPPLVPALGRASRPADPAASLHGHRDRDGR